MEKNWSTYPIEVNWEGGKRFRGGAAGGPSLVLDGDRVEAPGPVDSLVIAAASCTGIDVVDFLEKRRTPAASIDVHIEFARAAEPPRRLTDVRFTFRVATDSAAPHVERSVQLSMEKYCSVVNTFRQDVDISWKVEVEPAPPRAE